MLTSITGILSIIGIALLIILGILLCLLLLVLFWPLCYRCSGMKSRDAYSINARLTWLWGLFRVRADYPVPGQVTAHILGFTLYDSAQPKPSKGQDNNTTQEEQPLSTGAADKSTAVTVSEPTGNASAEAKASENGPNNSVVQDKPSEESNIPSDEADVSSEESEQEKGLFGAIKAKYRKIQYTICKICDKIRYIRENITFYKELFQEEDTQQLIKHAFFRVRKIWKNIRPGKIEADILFGTGSPDTTGYVLALYGILSPSLGKHINIRSDFEEAILEGEFLIKGHITIFQILFHALCIAFDKRLRVLIRKINNHTKKNSNP